MAKQQAFNAQVMLLIAVCFFAVKNVSGWKSWDLDFILDQGTF